MNANDIKKSLQTDVAEMQERLSVNVLDGTPYLLILTTEDGDRVYGDWHTPMGNVKGFESAELIPNHLCGTIQMSPENALQNVARLAEHGMKVRAEHWRVFVQSRITKINNLIEVLSAGA